MYCHEECLVQWLEHSRKDRCEVCGYTFEFEPVYASDAPERVSALVMMSAGAKFLATRIMPFLARILLSALLWLVAAPLATCVLYRAWVHRPSDQPVSWTARRLAEELGSGLAIAVAIIVSFLSLLSFTDYMRVRWEIMEMEVGAAEDHIPLRDLNNRQRNGDAPREGANFWVAPFQDEEDLPEQRDEVERVDEDDREDDDDDEDERADAGLNVGEEDEEIELHIAMDELLGLRGPVINVARNVSWLVVFNAAYLGLFAFIPFAVGSVISNLARTAAPRYALANDAMANFAAGLASTWNEHRDLGHGFAASAFAAAIAGSRQATTTLLGNTAVSDLTSTPRSTRSYASSLGRWAATAGRFVVAVGARAVSLLVRRRGVGPGTNIPSSVMSDGSGGSGSILEAVLNATAANSDKLHAVSRGTVDSETTLFVVVPPSSLNMKTVMSFVESGVSGVASRLDSLSRAFFDIGVSLGTAWGSAGVDSYRLQSDRSPPPTLRLDDLSKMALGYVALGVVACAWRAALKTAPRWLRRRAPARALRRAEKALDAAAAAAKVAALLTLKMILLPSILGAGLDAALSSHALFTVQATQYPIFKNQHVAPSAVPELSNTTFIIYSPLTEYRVFHRMKNNFIPAVSLGHDGDLIFEKYAAKLFQENYASALFATENYTSKILAMARRIPPLPKSFAVTSMFAPDVEEDGEDVPYKHALEGNAHDTIQEQRIDDEEDTRGDSMSSCDVDNTDPEIINKRNWTSGRDHLPATNDAKREEKTKVASGVAAAVRELGGGALGVALCRWVLGITFMLVVTVAVLQLREVLHPAVLARHVRPHQHRPDLLATLLAEPAKAHARRLATSLAIYGALLAVAVAAPAVTYSVFSGHVFDGPRPFFVLRFCYVLPRAQIPVELVVFHLCVLGLLERLKARLRDAQTLWLGFACRRLDLDGFFLPKIAPNMDVFPAAAWHRGVGGRARGGQHVPGNGHRHGNNDIHDLERRWAWGDEPLGPRERALVPRVAPDRFFSGRVTLLVVGSWLVMVVSTAFVMLGPIVLGRFFLDIFRLPQSHDPFALVVGWSVLLFVFEPWLDGNVPGFFEDNDELDEPRLLGRNDDNEQLRPINFFNQDSGEGMTPVVTELGEGIESNFATRKDKNWLAKGFQVFSFGLLWFIVLPLAFGALYDVAFVASKKEWGTWQPPFSGSTARRSTFPPLDWSRNWLVGLILLNTLMISAARVVLNEGGGEAGREAQPQNQEEEDGLDADRRNHLVPFWTRVVIRLHDLLVRKSGLVDGFDPLLLYEFAVPFVFDLLKIMIAPMFPTLYVASWLDPARSMMSEGESSDADDNMAEMGTRILVAYRYSLAATIAVSVAMTLVEPVTKW